MNPRSFLTPSFLFFSFSLLLYRTSAFNVSKILGQYPDFSSFNGYLTQTQLVAEINSRQTITVLAVENSATSPLSGKSTNDIKKILSLHVVLDYYDIQKFQQLPNKTAILTTLLQASGQATGQQGFLNVTDLTTGGVAFRPAVKGSTLSANLVKSVASQPYNISVVQISTVIIPSAAGNSSSAPTPSPNSPPPAVASPVQSPSTGPPNHGKAPVPSTAKTPSTAPSPKSSTAPAPTTGGSSATVPSVSPSSPPAADAVAPSGASTPSDADAPSSASAPSGASVDSPLSSPPSLVAASGPAADASTGAADAPGPVGDSSGTSASSGVYLVVLVIVVSSTWSLISMI